MGTKTTNTKNVLLTTMSIFNGSQVNNYYEEIFDSENDKYTRKYCHGVSSLEPGSKYILSKHRIDKIVVVGSDKTIKDSDARKVADLIGKWKAIKDENKAWEKELSPYEFYKYSMCAFLNNENKILKNVMEREVGVDRQKVLKEKVDEVLSNYQEKAEYKDLAVVLSKHEEKEKNELYAMINKSVEDSIEADFEMVKGLFEDSKHKDKIEALTNRIRTHKVKLDQAMILEEDKKLTEQSQCEEQLHRFEEELKKYEELTEEQIESFKEEINEYKEFTPFEKEYLYLYLHKMVEQRLKLVEAVNTRKLLQAAYKKKDYKDVAVEMLDINGELVELSKKLSDESAKLKYDIDNMKKQRKQHEMNYAIYYVLNSLGSEYYIQPHCDNLKEGHKIEICFVDEKKESDGIEIDNINEIADAIKGDGNCEVKLYVDVQGGNRTSGYVRNAVIQIMNNQDAYYVDLKDIVATDFSRDNKWGSEILNERDRYRIMDLAAGMNAFIRYGKADLIKQYCIDMGVYDEAEAIADNNEYSVSRLVKHMENIDDAISICDVDTLEEEIDKLDKCFKKRDVDIKRGKLNNQTYVDNIFDVLQHGIKADYGKLLKAQPMDYIELIEWSRRKGFTQQALTLIEAKMAQLYCDKGLINYKDIFDNKGKIIETKKEAVKNMKRPNYETIWNQLFYGISKLVRERAKSDELEVVTIALANAMNAWSDEMTELIDAKELTYSDAMLKMGFTTKLGKKLSIDGLEIEVPILKKGKEYRRFDNAQIMETLNEAIQKSFVEEKSVERLYIAWSWLFEKYKDKGSFSLLSAPDILYNLYIDRIITSEPVYFSLVNSVKTTFDDGRRENDIKSLSNDEWIENSDKPSADDSTVLMDSVKIATLFGCTEKPEITPEEKELYDKLIEFWGDNIYEEKFSVSGINELLNGCVKFISEEYENKINQKKNSITAEHNKKIEEITKQYKGAEANKRKQEENKEYKISMNSVKSKLEEEKKNVVSKIQSIVKYNINTLYCQKLDKTFLLHEALKLERNNSNHAIESKLRIPQKVVNHLIGEYIEGVKQLIAVKDKFCKS